MDFAKEEASLIYEDRMQSCWSPSQINESEDEDNQQELEEMLYSQVHHNNSLFDEAPPEEASLPVRSVTIQSVSSDNTKSKVGFASLGISEPTQSVAELQLQAGCTRSQFNHPNRRKASRYYDVSKDACIPKPVFAAPMTPHQTLKGKNISSPVTDRVMQRSSNLMSYPSNKSIGNQVVSKGRVEVLQKGLPNSTTNKKSLDQPDACSSQKGSYGLESVKDANDASESLPIPVQAISSQVDDHVAIKNKEDKKRGKEQQSACLPKNSKQRSFEAKVSKVLSSMLDEESRSSVDDNQSSLACRSQNLSDRIADSGWSVGMSWADMSSKFSFEVDSIEEESVSSLQLPEDSTPSGSRTNTPDLQKGHAEIEPEKESDEESRYQIQLKSAQKVSDKERDECVSDTDSEVGSIVEVVPPSPPTPPLVDISDGEYVPLNEHRKDKTSSQYGSCDDITVVYTKQRNACNRGTADSCNVIDSSSDDDVVLLNVSDSPKPNTVCTPRGPSKRHCAEGEKSSGDTIPSKRHSSHQFKDQSEVKQEEGEQILKEGKALLEEPLSTPCRKETEEWLYNPLKAFKSLDHGKALRKMSDDPSLWKICYADQIQTPMSPHGPKCSNCNQFGHKPRFCPSPRKIVTCHMCGMQGHSETRCTQKMCLRCGRKTPVFVDRCKSCVSNKNLCKVCASPFHFWRLCPDLWRRYHLTTAAGEMTKPSGVDVRPLSEQWCSNCAKKGHLSHKCQEAHWKCETISPYITSYKPVDGEKHGEERTKLTMLVTDESAVHLLDADGKEFLGNVSKDCNVQIHTSLQTTLKKLAVKGSPEDTLRAQGHIKEWVKEKSESESSTSFEECDSQTPLAPAWFLVSTLPKKYETLADVLTNELRILESPIPLSVSVKEMYQFLGKCKKSRESSNKRKAQKHCYRLLNMILIGKCGFEEGEVHLHALKRLVRKLREKKGSIKVLYNVAKKHHDAVFSSKSIYNYESLVEKFYSNEDLVKQFDCSLPPVDMENLTVKSILWSHGDMEQSVTPAKDNPDHGLGTSLSSSSEAKRCHAADVSKEAGMEQRKLNTKLEKEVLDHEKKLHVIVPAVIQNLSSRFIFSESQQNLVSLYRLYCNSKKMNVVKRQGYLNKLQKLSDMMCRSYGIKLDC